METDALVDCGAIDGMDGELQDCGAVAAVDVLILVGQGINVRLGEGGIETVVRVGSAGTNLTCQGYQVGGIDGEVKGDSGVATVDIREMLLVITRLIVDDAVPGIAGTGSGGEL